jgi:phosphonopyruvate decarboxylase
VALDEFLGVADGPALLHFRTRRGVPEGLPRPDVRPREVKQRLMRHIGAEAPWRDH